MAVNDAIADRLVAHQIRLIRLANGSVRKVNEALARAQKLIVQLVAALAEDGSDSEGIVRAIRTALAGQTPLLRAAIQAEISALVPYEADAMIAIMRGALPQAVAVNFARPDAAQLGAVLLEPLAGKTIDEWFADLTDAAFRRFRSAVREGFLEGQTTSKIVSKIREDFEISRHQAATVVRTLMATLANRSRQLVFEANADIIAGLQWRSTLDPKTCPVCASRDGVVYAIDKGPRPPAHPNCRCKLTAVVKGADELGLPPATRASMDGEVPATTTFGEWLARQPAVILIEVLGVKRAKLYRATGKDLGDFINDEGEFYTLDELKRRDRAAWAHAGLP